MNRTLIIFDGEQDHEIGLAYFYQNPLIESATRDQIVDYYVSTAVFAQVINDSSDLIRNNIINAINDKAIGPDYIKKVERGVSILEKMLEDLFGKDSAQDIINLTRETIND
jgi:ABC-type iron transport system FetAB ATPase subunit